MLWFAIAIAENISYISLDTVCPISLDQFYIMAYYINLVKTSSISEHGCSGIAMVIPCENLVSIHVG